MVESTRAIAVDWPPPMSESTEKAFSVGAWTLESTAKLLTARGKTDPRVVPPHFARVGWP